MSNSNFSMSQNNNAANLSTESISTGSRRFNTPSTSNLPLVYNDIIDIEEYDLDEEFDISNEMKLYSLIRELEEKINSLEKEYQELSTQISSNPTDIAAKLSMITNSKKEYEKKLSVLKEYENQIIQKEIYNSVADDYKNGISLLEIQREKLLNEMKENPSQEISNQLIEINNKIEKYNKQLSIINTTTEKANEIQSIIDSILNSGGIETIDSGTIQSIKGHISEIGTLNSIIEISLTTQSSIDSYKEKIEQLKAKINSMSTINHTEIEDRNKLLENINTYEQIIKELELNLEVENEIAKELAAGKKYSDIVSDKFERYITTNEDKATIFYILEINELLAQIQLDPQNEELLNKYESLTNPQKVYEQYLYYIFKQQEESGSFVSKYDTKITRIEKIAKMLGFNPAELYEKQIEYLKSQDPKWWEQLLAGSAKAVMSVGSGFAKGGEVLLDISTLITSGLAMIGTSIFDLATGKFGNPNSATYAVKNAAEEAVGIDRVKECEESLIKYDKVFKWIENKSPDLWKQDGMLKSIIEGLSEIAFQLALGDEISATTNVSKAIGIVLSAGMKGFSHGTERALQDGTDLGKAGMYGLASGSWEVIQWTLGQKLEFLKGYATAKGASKAQKYISYMAYILTNGEDAAVESLVQPLLQMSYSDKSFDELYEENGGNVGLGIQFGFGVILSSLSIGLDTKKIKTPKKETTLSEKYAEYKNRISENFDLKENNIECDFKLSDRSFIKVRKFFTDQKIDGVTNSELDKKISILFNGYYYDKINVDDGYKIIREYLNNDNYKMKNPTFYMVLNALDDSFKNGNKEYAFECLQNLCNNIDRICFFTTYSTECVRGGFMVLLNPDSEFNHISKHELGHLLHSINSNYYIPNNLEEVMKNAQESGKNKYETLTKLYELITKTRRIDYADAEKMFVDDIIKKYGSIDNCKKDIFESIMESKSHGTGSLEIFIRENLERFVKEKEVESTLNNIMKYTDWSNEKSVNLLVEQIYNMRLKKFKQSYSNYNSIAINLEDLIASIYKNDTILIDSTHKIKFSGHTKEYYDSRRGNDFIEIVANYNDLKLSGREDLIDQLRDIFGDELFDLVEKALGGN